MERLNPITQREPGADSWQPFEGFTDVFPALECYRHSAHNYFTDVIKRKSQADTIPIPLGVLFARSEVLQGVMPL